ncbi:MAG: tetratricopeptide (TPR) repeat protein [Vicingaceae bacterium]|jgi:tetratricopeptide (TPR) repeat protein
MRKLGLLMIVALMAGSAFGQKYGADSVKCIENLSLYKDYYKQKMYNDAYKYWKVAYDICPASSEKMYVDGVALLKRREGKAKTEAQKSQIIDSIITVYDRRKENFGSNQGRVDGRKGTDLLRYKSDQPELPFVVLESAVNEGGNYAEAGTVASYMNAAVLMERVEKKTPEDVVKIFGQLTDILAFNIAKYEGKKTQEYYVQAKESVNDLASPYLSCDVLVKMAEDGYEKNKADATWMERTADILDKKNCTDAPIFFTIAKEMHASSPSSVSAEKMGIMSLKNKEFGAAENFFQQAIDLAQDETKKADYYIELAEAQRSAGKFGPARTNARKAASLKGGWGLPYLMIGDMIVSSSCVGEDACAQKAIYWLAADYYNKAKSVDPSVSGKANGKIATYSKYFPTQEDCFFGGTKAGDTVNIGCWIGESTKARF